LIRHRGKYWSESLAFCLVALLIVASPLLGQSIVINEILASNQTGITDEDMDTSDWIELYNLSNEAINLDGYTLTDESDDTDQWAFPAVMMEPAAYLLIWASGKDRVDSSELHTNFKLNASGEYVGLYDPGGIRAHLGIAVNPQRQNRPSGTAPPGAPAAQTC